MQANSAAFGGIPTSVAMSYPASGQWDAAYDIWFDPTARRDGQNTGALSYNGSVAPGSSTTFGLQADGTAGAPALTCTAS